MRKLRHYIFKTMARTALYLMFTYRRLKLALRRLPKDRKSVVFYLEDGNLYRADDGMGRYAYLILNAFSGGGYNVYLCKSVDTFRKYRELGKYGRLMYTVKNLKMINRVPEHIREEEALFAFDRINEQLMSRKWKRLVYVNILWPSFCKAGDVIWRPYYFHPTTYTQGLDKNVEALRLNQRKLRIFFAGNAIAQGYSLSKLRERYNQLTRHEGVTAALELMDKVKTVEDTAEFLDMVNNGPYLNECRLLMTNRTVKLSVADYWDTLSKSDFFLCFSGTDLPQCHNSVEAMAVGTIPIIAYPDWFFPALEDGKNAILYSGTEDMKAKILKILAMPNEEILHMRKNVLEYYEKHLSNRSFIEKVENHMGDYATVMQHPRLVCSAQEDENGRQFMLKLKNALHAR